MVKNNTRIDYLDGLRGWAALVVCMHHSAQLFSYPGCLNPPKILLFIQTGYFRALLDGPLSVKIFFVLSGFVLSISFIKNQEFKKLAALLIKRIPRLSIPIFAMALITHFFIKTGVEIRAEAYHILGNNAGWILSTGWDTLGSTIFKVLKSSFLLSFFSMKSYTYNGALWTMPHEMVGSIFVAVVLFLASFISRTKRIIPIIVLFGALMILSSQNAVFAGTLICFLFGILLAYYLVNRNKTPPLPYSLHYKILLIIIILLLYYSKFNSNLIDIKGNLIAILIIFLVIISPYLQKMLSSRFSIFLGRISFPLYIVHTLIICLLTSYLITQKYDPNNTVLVLIYFTITVVGSIIAAWILYPVEKFAIAFSHKTFEYFSTDKKIGFGKAKDYLKKVKSAIELKIASVNGGDKKG